MIVLATPLRLIHGHGEDGVAVIVLFWTLPWPGVFFLVFDAAVPCFSEKRLWIGTANTLLADAAKGAWGVERELMGSSSHQFLYSNRGGCVPRAAIPTFKNQRWLATW